MYLFIDIDIYVVILYIIYYYILLYIIIFFSGNCQWKLNKFMLSYVQLYVLGFFFCDGQL